MENIVLILARNSSTQDLLDSIKSFKAAGVKNICMLDSAKYGFTPILDSSVKLFHTEEALLWYLKEKDGWIYVTTKFNAPRDFVKVIFERKLDETKAYGLAGTKILSFDKTSSVAEVETWDRGPNGVRYLRNDTGDREVDFFTRTGFLFRTKKLEDLEKVYSLETVSKAGVVLENAGLQLICIDSPWGRPVRLSMSNKGRKCLSKDESTYVVTAKNQKNKEESEEPVKIHKRTGRTIVSMATYEAREKGALSVIDTMSKQCDEMYVALNGYEGNKLTEILLKLSSYKNVHAIPYTGNMDLGCQSRNRALSNCLDGDYFIVVDDDLFYPDDYVNTITSWLDKVGHDCIVSYHGSAFDVMSVENPNDYINRKARKLYAYREECNDLMPVNSVGGGVTAYVPKAIGIDFSAFDAPKNTGDDELIAIFAAKNNIKMYVVPHSKNYIKCNKEMQFSSMTKDITSREERVEKMLNALRKIELEKTIKHRKDITVVTFSYNTDLANKCLSSLFFQLGYKLPVIVMDDGKIEFKPEFSETTRVIDNRFGKLIRPTGQNSNDHMQAIEYALMNEVKTKYAMLCDDDILFKPKIKELILKTFDFDACGGIGFDIQPGNRLFPYMCIIDVEKMKHDNIKYYDETRSMLKKPYYDTGRSFLLDILAAGWKIQKIDLKEYIEHLKGASIHSKTADKWLEENKNLLPNSKFFGIVIPVRSRAEKLDRALASIKSQKEVIKDLSVVVVDDFSPMKDFIDIASVVKKYNFAKLVRLEERKMAGGARNYGVAELGDVQYVHFLDSDDEYASSTALADLKKKIIENNYPDLVHCSYSSPTGIKQINCNTPKELAELCFIAPWTRCVKKSKVCKFVEMRRMCNDVVQMLRTVDIVNTVCSTEFPVVRYYKDSTPTGWSNVTTRKEPDAIKAQFMVGPDIVDENFTHEYTKKRANKELLRAINVLTVLAKYLK